MAWDLRPFLEAGSSELGLGAMHRDRWGNWLLNFRDLLQLGTMRRRFDSLSSRARNVAISARSIG